MKFITQNILSSTCLRAFFIGILLLLAYGCDNENPSENVAYLGGEIINPTSRYIILQKNGKTLDSIRLDDKNRFSYRLDSVETGIYIFKHRPEIQQFYISPGDSLLLRANTLAFDESLHYSGTGEAQNNFITEMLLMDKENADLLLSFYKIPPVEFLKKTDSIKKVRLSFLEKQKNKKDFSEDFVSLSEKIINYESYDLKERYVYLVTKYHKEYQKKLPKDFFEYRKDVLFNDPQLQETITYRRFIENYLINKSLENCKKHQYAHQNCFERANTKNVLKRIKMVGDLIQIPALRNHFLLKLGAKGIVVAKSQEEITAIIEALRENDFPENEIKDMEQLGIVQTAYLPGTEITNVPLINSKGDTIPSLKIVKKPTIVFLWSIYKEEHQKDHQLIADLRKKYPEIDFIGINLDIGETDAWKMAIQKYNYNQDYEYQLGKTEIEKRFFQYYLNKLIFLDNKAKVISGDTFLNSPNFESKILEFLNR